MYINMATYAFIKENIQQIRREPMDNSNALKERFTKTDTLCIKALAVILMVCHHLFAFPDKLTGNAEVVDLITFSDGNSLSYYIGQYGKLCVALFMMLSGYGVYKSYKNNGNNITGTITRRIKTAYIKYWQIFAVMVPVGLIIGSEKVSLSLPQLLKNFFAIETTINDEWWFMTLYIIMLFIFPLAVTWIDRKKANVYKDFLIVVAFNAFANTALLTFLDNTKTFELFNGTYFCSKMRVALVMLSMFVTGSMLAKYNIIESVLEKVHGRLLKIFLGIGLLAITVILRKDWAMPCMWGWDRLDFIYSALFIIAFALILYKLDKVKVIFAKIGEQSTGIWLIHTFLCYYYFQELIYAAKNPFLILVITVAVSWGLSWCTSYVFRLLGSFLKPLFNTEK